MITRINIENFGPYQGFLWGDHMRDPSGNVLQFGKKVVLYGRNYSGKTTLSRILRSIELGRLPDGYQAPRFEVHMDGIPVTPSTLTHPNPDLRVFNSDFITDNLSILRSRDGTIQPFAVIGRENKAISERIKFLLDELGTEDDRGTRRELAESQGALRNAATAVHNAETARDDSLRKYANGTIKHNRIYGTSTYNLPAIVGDIEIIRSQSITQLSDEQRAAKLEICKESKLPSVTALAAFSPADKHLFETAKELLEREISPTHAIKDLLEDALLQEWVQNGLHLHRGKRESCGFCRRTLPPSFWEEVEAHFNKESETLRAELDALKLAVDRERTSLSTIEAPSPQRLYSIQRPALENAVASLTAAKSAYASSLDALLKGIRARHSSIFEAIQCPDQQHHGAEVVRALSAVNDVVGESNAITQRLDSDQADARNTLRLDDVLRFMSSIALDETNEHIETLIRQKEQAIRRRDEVHRKVAAAQDEVDLLRTQLHDERLAAQRINELLGSHFGHEVLRLDAASDSGAQDGPVASFRVTRGGVPAFNLSEGECNLVAICYFITRLQDSVSNGRPLTVVIDDPVSSLDNNHIFFVYSLIQSQIARPVKSPDGSLAFPYHQLIISTHNLDFLKYLRRLQPPPKVVNEVDYALAELRPGGSVLRPMPDYMKQHATEFLYLFHQIYKCSRTPTDDADHECFFVFGNNLRKFLEAYLFYKYPDMSNQLERIQKFFGGDAPAVELEERIANELSHLAAPLDRSTRPLDVPEIPRLAKFVLDKLEEHDPEQFRSMLRSVGVSTPPAAQTPPQDSALPSVAGQTRHT